MLSVSCARSFASSLVAVPQDAMSGVDGATLDLADLFGSVWVRAFVRTDFDCGQLFLILDKAERSDAPLSPEVECGTKERQSCKQLGGAFVALQRDRFTKNNFLA